MNSLQFVEKNPKHCCDHMIFSSCGLDLNSSTSCTFLDLLHPLFYFKFPLCMMFSLSSHSCAKSRFCCFLFSHSLLPSVFALPAFFLSIASLSFLPCLSHLIHLPAGCESEFMSSRSTDTRAFRGDI